MEGGEELREMEDMFGFFTIGKCKGRVKGGGILRRNMGNALAGFSFFHVWVCFFREFISYSSQLFLLLACVIEFKML